MPEQSTADPMGLVTTPTANAGDGREKFAERDRDLFLYGRGSWSSFRKVGASMADIERAAAHWKASLRGIKKPWLVWNAHSDWCWVQQNLIEAVGWTPVVGYDPRVGPPDRLSSNAVLVDFNKELVLPFLHPVFVLEFIFLFAERLAFWHSDLLLPLHKMQRLADQFEHLPQGSTAATSTWRPARFWRRPRRVWELVGCSTRSASADQFANGAGWWSNIFDHVQSPPGVERETRRQTGHWDHGGGVLYWARNYNGVLKTIPRWHVEAGHFSATSHPHLYSWSQARTTGTLRAELDQRLSVQKACEEVGINWKELCGD